MRSALPAALRRNRRTRGFTLVEMLVCITIMMILYTGMPDILGQLQGPRLKRAYSDAAMLAEGLWGPNPDYQGFVGDVGLVTPTADPSSIPSDGPLTPQGVPTGISLDLVFPQNSTSFATPTNALGVTAGWNGPYAGFDLNALSVDPWGTPWKITPSGQIQSWGPDQQQNTADDVYSPWQSPIGASNPTGPTGPMLRGVTGTITLTLIDVDGGYITDANMVDIVVWEPKMGALPRGTAQRLQNYGSSQPGGTLTFTPGAAGTNAFVISNVPPGRRAIEVYGNGVDATRSCDGLVPPSMSPSTCSSLYGHGVVNVIGGGVAALEIKLRESVDYAGQ